MSEARRRAAAFYGVRAASQFGQSLALAGLFVLAGTSAHMAWGLSSVFVGMMAGAILCGLPGGALADHLGPARALVVGALLRLGASVTALAVVPQPHFVMAASFAYSAASQLFSPAELALVAAIHPERAARAHGFLVAAQYACHGLGAALAPVLFFLWGPSAAILAAAAVYAAVVPLALFLAREVERTGNGYRVPTRTAFALRHVADFFVRRKPAGQAALALVFNDLATKCLMVAAPVYLHQELGLGRAELALLAAPAAAGIAAGSFWAMRFARGSAAVSAARAAVAGATVGLVALAGLSDGLAAASAAAPGALGLLADPQAVRLAVAVPVALLLGAAFGTAPIAGRAALTELTPRTLQARAFAAQSSLSDLVVLAPLVGAGVGVETVGARLAFAMVAGLGLALLLSFEGARLRRWAAAVLFEDGPLGERLA
ncbi:MAG: MFS transporter [Chloroflexota bacterium]|nr:MFS transporter [Chloroflexota bacterium]